MSISTISDSKMKLMSTTTPTAPTYISPLYPGVPHRDQSDHRGVEHPASSAHQHPLALHQAEMNQIEQIERQQLQHQQMQMPELSASHRGQSQLSQLNEPYQPAPEITQRSESFATGLRQHFANSEKTEPAGPETSRVVVINNGPLPFGHESQTLNCPHCFQRTRTFLKYRPTFRTHLMALIFCFTGLWCLTPLPYCLNTCRSTDHHCTNCRQLVGKSMS